MQGWRGGGEVGAGEGAWELRCSAVRTGSVQSIRVFKISDANGSVSDTLRYAIKSIVETAM